MDAGKEKLPYLQIQNKRQKLAYPLEFHSPTDVAGWFKWKHSLYTP